MQRINEFSKAIADVDYILKYTDEKLVKKIPQSFWNFIEENKDENYQVIIDVNIPLEDQNIGEDTKNLMAIIYRNYFCTLDEKREYNQLLSQNQKQFEKEMNEKYSYENLFRNNKIEEEKMVEEQQNPNTQIIVYKEENIFDKIINQIKFLINKLRIKFN